MKNTKDDLDTDAQKNNVVEESASTEETTKKKTSKIKKSKEVERLKVKNEGLLNEIESLKQALQESKDSEKLAKEDALRNLAELENFKKRKNQEVESFKKYSVEEVFKEFLPVIDNFLIACDHVDKHDQAEAVTLEGFVLIKKQLDSVMTKLNVKTIESESKQFDPNFHQAIGQKKVDDVEANVVIQEVQKGFLLHDKVIRPSMVIVSE